MKKGIVKGKEVVVAFAAAGITAGLVGTILSIGGIWSAAESYEVAKAREVEMQERFSYSSRVEDVLYELELKTENDEMTLDEYAQEYRNLKNSFGYFVENYGTEAEKTEYLANVEKQNEVIDRAVDVCFIGSTAAIVGAGLTVGTMVCDRVYTKAKKYFGEENERTR